MFGLSGGECAKEDGLAAVGAQTVGKSGDHGCGDASPPRGLQREQILNHADAVGGGGVSSIGDGNAVLHREADMVCPAFGPIAGDHASVTSGGTFETAGAPAFGMIGDELEQRVPLRLANYRAQLGSVRLDR